MTLKKLSLGLLICLMPLGTAFAQNAKDIISVRVLTGARITAERHISALHLQLKPGWKTYWRSPGKTGLAPEISFVGSKNLKSIRILWPSPIVFGPKEMWSIGYKDRLVLPLRLTPKDKTAPVALTLDALVGLCENICVPAEFTLSQILRAGAKKRSPKIVAALVDKPASGRKADLQKIACRFSRSNDDISVKITLNLPHVGNREVMMIEYEQPNHWVMLSSSSRSGPVLTAQARISRKSGPITSIERSKVRITVVSTTASVNVGTCSQ